MRYDWPPPCAIDSFRQDHALFRCISYVSEQFQLPSSFIALNKHYECTKPIKLNFISKYKDGLGRAKNPVKYLQSIEQRARERQVAYETVRLLRQDVIECYRKEGVNHYENCKGVVDTYSRVVLKRDVGQVNPTYKDEKKNYGF